MKSNIYDSCINIFRQAQRIVDVDKNVLKKKIFAYLFVNFVDEG